MEPAPVKEGLFGPNSRITSAQWNIWLTKLAANIGSGGNGSNGFASNTVSNETSFSVVPSAGTATTYSRGDHTHGTPVNPVIAHVAANDPHPQYQHEITPNAGWSVNANYTQDKTINPEATSLTEVARVLGTLIDALKSIGILGA